MIGSLLLVEQKREYNLVVKDIDTYKEEIDNLENEINSYDTKKEQVKEELVSGLDENKRKEYEAWEKQIKYLNEALK